MKGVLALALGGALFAPAFPTRAEQSAKEGPLPLPRWELRAPTSEFVGFGHPLGAEPLPRFGGSPESSGAQYVPGEPLPPGMKPPPEYPYRHGDLLPEGYVVEERPKRGFLIAGYVVTGVPYGLGLLSAATGGFPNETHWLVVPIAGPWLTFGLRDRACNEIGETAFDSWHCVSDRMTEWLLITDGIVQAIGGTFLVLAYALPTPFAVLEDTGTFVGPMVVGTGMGFGARGSL